MSSIDIDIKCECGNDLNIKDIRGDNYGNLKIEVEKCENCFDDVDIIDNLPASMEISETRDFNSRSIEISINR